MEWTGQQSAALDMVAKWYNTPKKDRKPVFRLFGMPGTGKSTLATHFANNIETVLFGAYTGKAALVMRQNGCEGATTLHSLLYGVKVDPTTGKRLFSFNKNSSIKDADLLIVDEVSMVNETMAKQILSFKTPVLVLGDPNQLPPIDGCGYFTNSEPDILLTEIHRQAKDSPIIWSCDRILRGYTLKPGDYGDSKVVTSLSTVDLEEHDARIVWKNATRHRINSKCRKILGFDDDLPMIGDRVVGIENDHDIGLCNGITGTVQKTINIKNRPNFINMTVLLDGDENPIWNTVHKAHFNDTVMPHWSKLKKTQKYDYGYAITCHKSQGSAWDSVLIFGEMPTWANDYDNWMITALSRAKDRFTLYVS